MLYPSRFCCSEFNRNFNEGSVMICSSGDSCSSNWFNVIGVSGVVEELAVVCKHGVGVVPLAPPVIGGVGDVVLVGKLGRVILNCALRALYLGSSFKSTVFILAISSSYPLIHVALPFFNLFWG